MKDGEQTTTALHFMIDRDGENFGYILEFLTNGHLVLPSNFPEYKLLLKEAQFYEIQREF